jgi:RNA-binding protein YlmH
MTAVYVAGQVDGDGLRAAARAAGVDAARLGDAVRHQDGVSLVVLEPAPEALLALRRVAGVEVAPVLVPLERVAAGTLRRQEVVVPSLRVDALGARAFRVSRSYFAKGVAAGRVSVNGRQAGKAAEAGVGDEVFADGLGRFRILSVERETRRGNVAVILEVERS